MRGVVRPPNIRVGENTIVQKGRALIGVLKVSPVNLASKTEAEEKALHGFYQELLDTISYPIQIQSRQSLTDLDDYVEDVGSGEGYMNLRSAYAEYCRQLGRNGIVDTEHFVVVRAGKGHDDVSGVLERRMGEVFSVISGGELGVHQLRGDDLRRFAADAFNSEPVPTTRYCASPNQRFDEYRKLIFVESYPSELGFGWPISVQRADGLVDVTQVVHPIDVEKAVRKLRRTSELFDAEIAVSLERGRRGVNRLERSLDDAEWFLDLLASQECRPLRLGAYITAHGSTREQVEQAYRGIVSRLQVLGIDYKQLGFRNDHAYYTDSPFYPDRLNERRLMPSTSAATGFPWGTQPFEDQTGVLYGVDAFDGTPILLDRFEWDSHSMVVVGTLGSGKSYFSKLELLRSMLVYPDLQVIVADPKREYRTTVEGLGGEMRAIEHGKEYSFDRQVLGFEVRERGEFENVAALVDLVSQIYSAVSKNRTRTLVLIDEARNILDDDAGRHALNQFVLEARDINTAVHMVTQSGAHFTKSREARDILSHVPGTVLFRHEDTEKLGSVSDHFNLSNQDQWRLTRLKGGKKAGRSEALLQVSNIVDTKIQIESTDVEHRIIDEEPTQLRGVEQR